MKNKVKVVSLIRNLLIGFILLMIVGIIVSAIQQKRSSNARQLIINIEPLEGGSLLINRDDIRKTIERSFGHNLEGTPLGELNVERVERVLEEDDFVLASNVYVDAQNDIHIQISQREPILRIIDKNGSNYYLDGEGKKMRLSKHFTIRALVATGNIPPYIADFTTKKSYMLNHIYELSKYILTDDLLSIFIEHIYIDEQNDIILIPKLGNQKIVFGAYEDVADKFNRLKIFYKEGLPYEGWQKYENINLKYKSQVVCKKRQS